MATWLATPQPPHAHRGLHTSEKPVTFLPWIKGWPSGPIMPGRQAGPWQTAPTMPPCTELLASAAAPHHGRCRAGLAAQATELQRGRSMHRLSLLSGLGQEHSACRTHLRIDLGPQAVQAAGAGIVLRTKCAQLRPTRESLGHDCKREHAPRWPRGRLPQRTRLCCAGYSASGRQGPGTQLRRTPTISAGVHVAGLLQHVGQHALQGVLLVVPGRLGGVVLQVKQGSPACGARASCRAAGQPEQGRLSKRLRTPGSSARHTRRSPSLSRRPRPSRPP